MSIDQYSSSPASNDLANYFQTGMRPSAVKTAGWDIMADLKDNLWSWPAVGGTANAITLTNSRAIGGSNPFNGEQHWFIPTAANTGTTTLKVDAQANTKNIFAYGAALLGGELQPNVPALVKFDGTQWNLLNPQDAAGVFTVTLTGFSGGTQTGTINWRKINGKTVHLFSVNSITGTSNASTLTGTGIPSFLNSLTQKFYPNQPQDNGIRINGVIRIESSNSWTFGASGATGGFTASGSKGLPAGWTTIYTLD